MREFVGITGLPKKDLNAALFDRMSSIYPEGSHPSGVFLCGLALDDPRLSVFMHALDAAGLQPLPKWTKRSKAPSEYLLSYRREYDQSDLRRAEYVVLGAEIWKGWVFDRGGPVELLLNEIHKRRHIAHIQTVGYVVSDALRKAIEAVPLVGAVFRETRVTDSVFPEQRTTSTWEQIGDPPWWQLSSNVALPPMSPSCVFVNREGDPYVEGQNMGRFLDEGFYDRPEAHYRREDLAAVGPFDIALTREQFGMHPNNWCPWTILSRRAFELIRRLDRKVEFIPVRIDEA